MGDIIKIGDFDISFKLIVGILVAIIIILGLMSLITGGGNDFTVNGVSFHIPDGFDEVTKDSLDTDTDFEEYTFKNTKNHEFIRISVVDFTKDESAMYDYFKQKGYKQETIDGKNGYGAMGPGLRYGYCYIDGGKYVVMDVPWVYDEEGMQHDKLISEIIK
ncbi:hypothetical protein [Methanobrevibacter sp.]|uniref:hypothetical protein n=1 Tax=Methanobrevibacter sp. TaxID=66852 RepID=UPI00388E7244